MTVPLIFRHGAAETAFIAAVAVWAVFEFVMRVRQRLRAGRPATPDASAIVLVPCLAAAVIATQVLGRRGGLPWPGGLVWPVVAGLALIVAGIGLRAWSIAALGRFFQYQIQIQPGHLVVTGGPYRYVRHPSYTGIALVLTGIALASDDAWSLVPPRPWAAPGWRFGSMPRSGSWPRRSAASTSNSRPAASGWCPACGDDDRQHAASGASRGEKNLASRMNQRAPERNRDAMDDDELIAAVAGGDDAALRELFSRHAPWLAARLRAVLPAADVEDALQETFLAVWQGARRLRAGQPAGPAGGWLWGIARRQAALLLRRRGPAAAALPAVLAAERAARPATRPKPSWPGPTWTGPSRRIGPAGGPEREVWRLLYVEDRPVAEVARLTGVPAGTVKSRAHRARQLLRAALGGTARWKESMKMSSTETGPPDVDLDRVWLGVAAQVWRREPGRAERAAGRLLRSPGLARALMTTPSLLLAVADRDRRGAGRRGARDAG